MTSLILFFVLSSIRLIMKYVQIKVNILGIFKIIQLMNVRLVNTGKYNDDEITGLLIFF